jgi:hypothetical protein
MVHISRQRIVSFILLALVATGAAFGVRWVLRRVEENKIVREYREAGRLASSVGYPPYYVYEKLGREAADRLLRQFADEYDHFFYDGKDRFVVLCRNGYKFVEEDGSEEFADVVEQAPVTDPEDRAVYACIAGNPGEEILSVRLTPEGIRIEETARSIGEDARRTFFIEWRPGTYPEPGRLDPENEISRTTTASSSPAN